MEIDILGIDLAKRIFQLALDELQGKQLAPSVHAHLTGVDDPF
ncbi:hypothetical protein AAER40_27815 [Klebsiella pneumoniae]